MRALREGFASKGFVEIEAPILVTAPSTEAHIDPLSTQVRLQAEGSATTRYLHTSPELALKRVVAAGIPRVFSVLKVFRDGERTDLHLPEFTLAEWYRTGGSLSELIEDVRTLLFAMATATDVDAATFDALMNPIVEHTLSELWLEHLEVDLDAALDEERDGDVYALSRRMREAGHAVVDETAFEDAFFHGMVSRIEPAIGIDAPVAVTRWPAKLAAFSRLFDDDDRFAQRFEIYWRGLELANAFDELTDPVEQRARMDSDNAARTALGKHALPIDELFLEDLAQMPPTVGIALGLERALMALWRAPKIDDVVVVPFR